MVGKMLTHVLRRSYLSLPGTRARSINCFYTHLKWMRDNRPTYAAFYFKNDWNPECSTKLETDYYTALEHEPFVGFVVDGSHGTLGERTKKYYSVQYEPTFLLLCDGMEIKRLVGSDVASLKAEMSRVRLFRSNLNWDFNLSSKSDIWEDYHDEYMKEWRQWGEGETREWDGTLVFDRS